MNFVIVWYISRGYKIFTIFGLMVFKKLLFYTQKMLPGSWYFFGASPTVPSKNFSPWFIYPCHIMAMSLAQRQFLGSLFSIFFCLNFWYFHDSILMEFYMDVKYLQFKFWPNRSTLRGVTTSFFINYTKKKPFFWNLGT